jgi:PhzF family phenazine biosynthesis protein
MMCLHSSSNHREEKKVAASIPIYQVDAFTNQLFRGNPAAVCPLDAWLPDAVMQSIAMENNLAETAFYVRHNDRFAIRWFTPAVEMDLCGHATLAAAFVLFSQQRYDAEVVEFDSRSGILKVRREGDLLTLDFPADTICPAPPQQDLVEALGSWPLEFHKGKWDYLLVYGSQDEIEAMAPDLGLLERIQARGVIVTAKGKDVDFVSRFFAPQVGVPEDPVTGSAHTTLAPYWAARLGKTELSAVQLSRRRGWLTCRTSGDRVEISGRARLYMTGSISLE